MVTDLFPGLQRYLYLFSTFEIGINLMGHFSKIAIPLPILVFSCFRVIPLSLLSRLFRNAFVYAESILAYKVSIVAVLLDLLMTRANFRSRIVSNEEKGSM